MAKYNNATQEKIDRLLALSEKDQDEVLGDPTRGPTPPTDLDRQSTDRLTIVDPKVNPNVASYSSRTKTTVSGTSETSSVQDTVSGMKSVPVPGPGLPQRPGHPNTGNTGATNRNLKGSMKHLAFGLPEVEVGDLKAMAEFHGGDFTATTVKNKLLNMSAQRKCHAFAAVRKSDNRIKILHSVGLYVAPLGAEIRVANTITSSDSRET